MNATVKRKLRTLFYGVTHEHAAGKLNTLRALGDDYEVVAVVDDRRRKSPRFIDPAWPIQLDGMRIISESEAWMLADVDVGFVETTNCDLMEIAGLFAERGIPIHCDKPCGEAVEPYRAILGEYRKRRLPLQIGYMFRGNPALRWIWEFVRGGGLGDVGFIEADMNHDYQAEGYSDYISTFRGGIMYNLGCHLVDAVYPMLRGEPVSVLPIIGDAVGDPSGARTNCKAYLRFGGTDVLLRTSSRMGGGNLVRRLRVDGTKGTIDLCPIERFDGRELVLKLTVGGHEEMKSFGVQTDRYADQLKDLAAVVRGEKENDQDYDRDLAVHRLTLKVCGLDEKYDLCR